MARSAHLSVICLVEMNQFHIAKLCESTNEPKTERMEVTGMTFRDKVLQNS